MSESDETPTSFESEAEFFWSVQARKVAGEDFPGNTRLVSVPFDEDSEDPIKSTIEAVEKMEEEVKNYMGEIPIHCCNIYADITGGMRTANMAMNSVLQLLSYEGAKLKRVVYSDFTTRTVSDVQPINDMYRLVAGVDAFTQYGRSEAIERYFDFDYENKGDNPESDLEKLLAAMHRFSDVVSLCWPDRMEKELEDLDKALKTFPKESNVPKENLLIQLLPTIQKKYDALLVETGAEKGKIDRLAVIEWCVKNNLIQPALTFCTEWLPAYIVDYGAIYADDVGVQKYCESLDSNKGNGKNYFIKSFCTVQPTVKKDGKNGTKEDDENLVDDIQQTGRNEKEPKKNALERIAEKSAMYVINAMIDAAEKGEENKSWKGRTKSISVNAEFIKKFSEFLRSIPQKLELEKAQRGSVQDAVFQYIIEKIEHPKNKENKKIFPQISLQDIYRKMRNLNWKTVSSKFRVGALRTYPYNEKNALVPEGTDTSESTEKICREMLSCGLMKTIWRKKDGMPDYDRAAGYIRSYTNIRANIRNKSHHAVSTDGKKQREPQTFNDVKNALEECLRLMRDLTQNEDAIEHKRNNPWPDKAKAAQQ